MGKGKEGAAQKLPGRVLGKEKKSSRRERSKNTREKEMSGGEKLGRMEAQKAGKLDSGAGGEVWR